MVQEVGLDPAFLIHRVSPRLSDCHYLQDIIIQIILRMSRKKALNQTRGSIWLLFIGVPSNAFVDPSVRIIGYQLVFLALTDRIEMVAQDRRPETVDR